MVELPPVGDAVGRGFGKGSVVSQRPPNSPQSGKRDASQDRRRDSSGSRDSRRERSRDRQVDHTRSKPAGSSREASQDGRRPSKLANSHEPVGRGASKGAARESAHEPAGRRASQDAKDKAALKIQSAHRGKEARKDASKRRSSAGPHSPPAAVTSQRTTSKRGSQAQHTPKAERKHLSPEERRLRWASLLQVLDITGDGMLDPSEFVKLVKAFADFAPTLRLEFGLWDVNSDGLISREEFHVFLEAMWQMLGERSFSSIEADIIEKSQGEKVQREAQEAQSAEANEAEWAELSTSLNLSLRKSTADMEVIDPAAELQQAMEATDSRSLRKSLRDARSCGVSRELITEGKERLRTLEAREQLKDAIESMDAGIVRIAIREVKDVPGITPLEISNAEGLLKKFAGRTLLDKALEKRDYKAFMKALEEAKQKGVTEEELAVYRQHLPALKVEASLRWALEREDPEDLMMSLSDALRVGVDPQYITKVENELVHIRERSLLRKKLIDVSISGKEKDVKEAIDTARAMGLSGPEMDRAESVLRKLQARQELARAVEAERSRPLELAIERAKAAHLEESLIEDAQQVLVRLGLRTNLNLAMAGEDVEALKIHVKNARDFIKKGWATGVRDDELRKAEAKLRMLTE